MQRTRTVIDDDSVPVVHCEHEGELIDAYISTVLLLKLKHGIERVDEVLAVKLNR